MKFLILLLPLLVSCSIGSHIIGDTLYDSHWVSARNRSDTIVTVVYYPRRSPHTKDTLSTLDPDDYSMTGLDESYDEYVFEYSHLNHKDTLDCAAGVTLRIFNNTVIPVHGSETDSEEM